MGFGAGEPLVYTPRIQSLPPGPAWAIEAKATKISRLRAKFAKRGTGETVPDPVKKTSLLS